MSTTSPIRVVQCPKCGSPVQGVSAGDIATCSYCGATLQVSAGASGHPVAKLANIEASTSYLARTEALKRVREQLARKDAELEELDRAYQALEHRKRGGLIENPSLLGVLGGVIALWVLGIIAWASDAVAVFALIGIPLILVAWRARWRRNREIDHQLEVCLELATQVSAERDRLPQRIAQLEAGLDDLAEQL